MGVPMTLRLATFNLKDFFSARTRPDVDERVLVEAKLEGVAGGLRRARADVVALQEVGSTELLDRLVKAVPELGYGVPVVGSEDRRGIRNVILSRLPVQWSQVHQPKALPFPRFVEGDPEPFPARIPLRRGVVHVRVEAGALGEVDVLTAHFKSNLPARQKTSNGTEKLDATPYEAGESAVRSLVQRAAEALYVRGLVDDVFSKLPDHAICVMGDLNDVPTSLPVRLVRGIDTSHAHHLRSCAETLEASRQFSCFHDGGPTLIDHLLVSRRLRHALRDFEIHNEALRYHGPHVDDAPITTDSDHALCVAEFGAPGRG
jgi:endonuclease/exonuclease/phosphatase family metal-dependent hydrolase